MIEVKNLVKKYGDHVAVDNLSFTVEKGQILGFLGPNGAGKSTTMNIITGYISATSGTVTVNGLDVYEEPEEVKKMIGYLPEFPPLYPDMTVAEYLKFVADIKKVVRSERAHMIAEVMEATKITPVAGRLIKHLSKGYKQRVGLAQAIIGYPELIILDEPTVGLDPKQIIEIRDLIRELSKNHTIILSSHIMQEVSAVCDTILIINKGKLIICDKTENLNKHEGSTGSIKLIIKGDRYKVINTLSGIDRVTLVEEKEHTNEGILNLIVHCSEDEDIREDVFFAMSDIKAPILEMQSIRMSLEDIFLKATSSYDYDTEPDSNNELQSDNDKPEDDKADTAMDNVEKADAAMDNADKADSDMDNADIVDSDKENTDKADSDKKNTNKSDEEVDEHAGDL